jgi:hypothetical protein
MSVDYSTYPHRSHAVQRLTRWIRPYDFDWITQETLNVYFYWNEVAREQVNTGASFPNAKAFWPK